MNGNALVEFVLVFPFFCLMFLGGVDLASLSFERLLLQRECWRAAKTFRAGGILPASLEKDATVSLEPLPFPSSRFPYRPARKIEIVHLDLHKEVPLRFPLLQLIFHQKKISLRVSSVALRMSHE